MLREKRICLVKGLVSKDQSQPSANHISLKTRKKQLQQAELHSNPYRPIFHKAIWEAVSTDK